MEHLQTIIENLPIMKWSDFFDILIVAFLIYKLMPILRSTGTVRVAGLVGIFLVITWLTGALNLYTLNFILNQFLAVGLMPENDAFAEFASLNDWGYFDSGEDCCTATPGIYVAGDCRSKGIRQVVTASADGAIAAMAACRYLD